MTYFSYVSLHGKKEELLHSRSVRQAKKVIPFPMENFPHPSRQTHTTVGSRLPRNARTTYSFYQLSKRHGKGDRETPSRKTPTEEIKRYKLAVTKQSQGCEVQHRDYSQ